MPKISSGRKKRSRFDFSSLAIKCSFCHNTFYARPADAVCPKCERPANRDLAAPLRAASLLLPPFGLLYALWLRPHSPIAAWQGLKWSLGGAAIYAAIAYLRTL